MRAAGRLRVGRPASAKRRPNSRVIDDVAAQLGDHALVEPRARAASRSRQRRRARRRSAPRSCRRQPRPRGRKRSASRRRAEPSPPPKSRPSPRRVNRSRTPIEPTLPVSRARTDAAEPWRDEPLAEPRRHPLRFIWQIDADGRFSIGSDEFTRLIGPHTAAGFGRLWSEIAAAFGLDPDGRVAEAVASRQHLERHHAELAGRRRRSTPAGRTVRPAGAGSRRPLSPAIAASASAAISTA